MVEESGETLKDSPELNQSYFGAPDPKLIDDLESEDVESSADKENENSSVSNVRIKKAQQMMFVESCRAGNYEQVLQCLKNGVDVNKAIRLRMRQSEEFEATGLWWAADCGHIKIVKSLLEYKAHTEIADHREGTTPLHRCVYNGYLDCTKALVEHGACISAVSGRNASTPLHLAARGGRPEICAYLIKKGASLTAKNRREDCPIAVTSHRPTLKVLLDPDLFNANGEAIANANKSSPTDINDKTETIDDDYDRPFCKLNPAMEKLFEMALELARKHIDSTIGVYPYDLLTHDEKIAVLAKVSVAVAGYASCPKDALHESALYALYVHAANAAQNDPNAGVWRTRISEAYDNECKWIQARGLVDCSHVKKEAWAVMTDLLAERCSFGKELFHHKQLIFTERDPLQQRYLRSQIGNVNEYFRGRLQMLNDADLADAERKIAALTPKGRSQMSGVFPPDHFASTMTMRQLVFSVEGNYNAGIGTGCGCETCTRCRQALLKPKARAKPKRKESAKDSLSERYDGDTKRPLVFHFRNYRQADGDKTSANGPAMLELTSDWSEDFGIAEKEVWNAISGNLEDIKRYYRRLTRDGRRQALVLPAKELDMSMAASRDWDLLATAEMEYDYGAYGSDGEGAVVEYDEHRDVFVPGHALLDAETTIPQMLKQLCPEITKDQARFWREPKKLELLDSKARQTLSTRVLELHFTRLFAIKLLCKFCDAAREATAQAALESLLRDEERIKKDKEAKESKKKKKANKSKKPTQASGHSEQKNEPESLDAIVIPPGTKDSELAETPSKDRSGKRVGEENNENKGDKAPYDHVNGSNANRKGERSRKENSVKTEDDSLNPDAVSLPVDSKNKSRNVREEKSEDARDSPNRKVKHNKKEGDEVERTSDIINNSPFAVLNEVGSEDEVKLNRVAEAEKSVDSVKADLKGSRNKPGKDKKKNSSAIAVQSSNGNSSSCLRTKGSFQSTSSAGRNGTATQKGGSSSNKPSSRSPEKATKTSLKPQAQHRKASNSADGLIASAGENSTSYSSQGSRVNQPVPMAAQSVESRAYITPSEDQRQENSNTIHAFTRRPNGMSPVYSHLSGAHTSVWSGNVNAYNPKSMWTQKSTSYDGFQQSTSAGEYNSHLQDPLNAAQATAGPQKGSRDKFLADPSVVPGATDKSTFYAWYYPRKVAQTREKQPSHHCPPGFGPPPNGIVNGHSRPLSYAALTSRNLSDAAAQGDDVQQPPRAPSHFQDGIIFTCTKFTMDECYQRNLLGLPPKDLALVSKARIAQTALFLFNLSTRELYGVYAAASEGKLNIEPDAWVTVGGNQRGPNAKDATSPYPAQIRFSVHREFPSVHESAFAHIFDSSDGVASLDSNQVKLLLDLFAREESKLSSSQSKKDLPSPIVNPGIVHPTYSGPNRYPLIQGPLSRDSRQLSSTPGPPHPPVSVSLAGHYTRPPEDRSAAENFFHSSRENMRHIQQDALHMHSEGRLQSVSPDIDFPGGPHGSSTAGFSPARESVPKSHGYTEAQMSRSPQRLVPAPESVHASTVEHGSTTQTHHFGGALSQKAQEAFRPESLSYPNGMHSPLFNQNGAFGMESNKMSMTSQGHSNPMLGHLPLPGHSTSYNQGVVGQSPQFENDSSVDSYSAFGGPHTGFGGLGNLTAFYGNSETKDQSSVSAAADNAFGKPSNDSIFGFAGGARQVAELAKLGIEEF